MHHAAAGAAAARAQAERAGSSAARLSRCAASAGLPLPLSVLSLQGAFSFRGRTEGSLVLPPCLPGSIGAVRCPVSPCHCHLSLAEKNLVFI